MFSTNRRSRRSSKRRRARARQWRSRRRRSRRRHPVGLRYPETPSGAKLRPPGSAPPARPSWRGGRGSGRSDCSRMAGERIGWLIRRAGGCSMSSTSRTPAQATLLIYVFKILFYICFLYIYFALSLKILRGYLSQHDGRHPEIQNRLLDKRWPCLELLKKVKRYLDGHDGRVAKIAFECKSGRHRSVVCAWMAEVMCRPD